MFLPLYVCDNNNDEITDVKYLDVNIVMDLGGEGANNWYEVET